MPRVLIVILLLALLGACGDDTTAPTPEPYAISGTVTDADGNPVADAAILLDLRLDDVGKADVSKSTSRRPQTQIQIALPEAGPVRIETRNACGDEMYSGEDLDLNAGVYHIPVTATDADGRQLTDRVLTIVVITNDGTSEFPVMLQRNGEPDDGDYGQWDHAAVVADVRIQATTDADGRFTVVDPCVGFGTTFVTRNEAGDPTGEVVVAWRVRAWAYHADHADGAASEWTDLDPDDGGEVGIVMGD